MCFRRHYLWIYSFEINWYPCWKSQNYMKWTEDPQSHFGYRLRKKADWENFETLYAYHYIGYQHIFVCLKLFHSFIPPSYRNNHSTTLLLASEHSKPSIVSGLYFVLGPIHLPHLRIRKFFYGQLESYGSVSIYGRLETYRSVNFHDLIFFWLKMLKIA